MTLPELTLPDLQPTLIGPTVTIRPIAANDWTELFAAGSDPAIWELHPARDRYTEPEFRKFFDGALRSKMAFVVADRESGALIGSSRYHGYEPAFGEIEVGWTFLVRKHWGGATNRELKRLMLDHAFAFASTVVFWVGEQNFRSQRAMEKIGGLRRAGVFTRELTGADKPYFIYEITRSAYEGAGRALLG
ncbi:GNAT family N-acetyltransferase [Bradyrhizobium sp.]|uniref:GNAT family N-acetyltransferase n=1 Tax=Bradyrhizobium sp. TaxID=376 RepID=UPI0025B84B57|nr:GNAT family N-acetyltransferase [Bradyrhizobium sp.]